MAIDPPAQHHQSGSSPSIVTPPQPFEIALIRKLESRTKSVRDAFLLLDVDGNGRISPADVRTVLHNEFGLDMTQEQEAFISSRFSGQGKVTSSCNSTHNGMSYGEFAKYFNDVSSATLPASQSGSAAAVGFRIEKGNESIDHELPIHLTPETMRLQLRHQLRQSLSAHSSRTHGGSGMKETSLFLAIDVHRSGKVTMQEFLEWLNSVGMEWDMEKLKLVLLGCDSGKDGKDAKQWEQHLFGIDGDGLEAGGKEAGMTEHEFAEFVESLDKDVSGDNVENMIEELQDTRPVVVL
jgi:Ca2+-binding EF-hand superfamily protein